MEEWCWWFQTCYCTLSNSTGEYTFTIGGGGGAPVVEMKVVRMEKVAIPAFSTITSGR